jgi:hypothetical protein
VGDIQNDLAVQVDATDNCCTHCYSLFHSFGRNARFRPETF